MFSLYYTVSGQGGTRPFGRGQAAVRLAGDTPVVATANLDVDVTNHLDEMDRMIETGVTGIVLIPPPDIFSRLSKQHGLAGIKDTTCTMAGIRAKIDGAAKETIVYQANAPLMLEAIAVGARGIMAVTSAAAADVVIQLWEAATSGAVVANDLQREVTVLDAVLRFGYPKAAKRLAQLRGIPMSLHCRWPVNLPEEAGKAIDIWYRGCRFLTGDM